MADTQIFADAFTYADGTLVGKGSPAWLAHYAGIFEIQVASNRLSSVTNAGINSACRPLGTVADSYAEIDASFSDVTSTTNTAQVRLRTDNVASTSRFIYFSVYSSGRCLILARTTDGGAATTLAEMTATDPSRPVWTNNTVKRLRGVTTQTGAYLYLDGALIISASDLNHTFTGTAVVLLNYGDVGKHIYIDNFAWGTHTADVAVTADSTADSTAPAIPQKVYAVTAEASAEAPAPAMPGVTVTRPGFASASTSRPRTASTSARPLATASDPRPRSAT